MASGHIRAGLVTHEDLVALEKETGVAAFLGVQAGDHLIYIAEAGSDHVAGFEARSNIRRTLLITAGGKALLAERPEAERELYLRRRSPDERDLVDRFLEEYDSIKRTRIATNAHRGRFAIATTVHNQSGEPVASITLVGPAPEVQPRIKKLSQILLRHVDSWTATHGDAARSDLSAVTQGLRSPRLFQDLLQFRRLAHRARVALQEPVAHSLFGDFRQRFARYADVPESPRDLELAQTALRPRR